MAVEEARLMLPLLLVDHRIRRHLRAADLRPQPRFNDRAQG